MSGVVEVLVALAPLLPMLVLPAAFAHQVLADVVAAPGRGTAPTRVGVLSGACQAVVGIAIGSAMGGWGPVLTLGSWWVAVWLLCLGVVVGAARWRRLSPTGERPRREVAGALVAALLVAGLAALAV